MAEFYSARRRDNPAASVYYFCTAAYRKFVEIAFELFCPVKPIPHGTVRGALQQATNFRRDSEEMPPDDVESALTEHSSDAD